MDGKPVTVLLVEDNDVDVEAVRRAFRKHKIANPIKHAKDGVQALEMLRSDGTIVRPYLILLDLNMPRMGGLELLKALRKDADLRNSIVFVLTTSASDQDKLETYDLNVAGYMVKSEVGKEFLNLINMLDHYWRVVEFPPALV